MQFFAYVNHGDTSLGPVPPRMPLRGVGARQPREGQRSCGPQDDEAPEARGPQSREMNGNFREGISCESPSFEARSLQSVSELERLSQWFAYFSLMIIPRFGATCEPFLSSRNRGRCAARLAPAPKLCIRSWSRRRI